MKTPRNGGHAHGVTVAAGLGHHVCVPALDTDTDPIDRFRSAEHGNVVPDVPPTPPRAVSGPCGWGEMPCQRHVSPHNPSRFETTVDTPLPAAASPQAATSRAGPNPGRLRVRANVDTTRTIASLSARRLVRGTKVGTSFSRGRAAGDRRIGRQSPPPAPSRALTPSPPAVPTARHRLRLRCPGPFRQSSAGVTRTTT
jgi:hypothetical protein